MQNIFRCAKYVFKHRRNIWRWLRILLARTPPQDHIQVYYGHDHIFSSTEHAYGGMIKFQWMQEIFPNTLHRFNVLYMGSSWRPKDWSQLLWLTRRKRAKLVWNQNGVAYPAWAGVKWQKINAPMATLLHAADYVFYQSRFCKRSADHFLGERKERYEILYNAVDTTRFVPLKSDSVPQHVVLLLGGNQYQYYRIKTAVLALAAIAKIRPETRLLITGKLSWTPSEAEASRIIGKLLTELQLVDHVQFLGSYTQQEAPEIFRKAHILLHTKYNDPCPGVVLEAMACGLPVVYSQSGGVPELVGTDAGIGIPAEQSWEQEFPPAPDALAKAVLRIAERRQEFAEAARQRAVEYFDLQPWFKRHREVFEYLLDS